jgi:hypothetical protein
VTAQPLPAAAPRRGVTRRTGNVEWVCVRPVHDTGSKNRGRQITGHYPQSERHYFVNARPHSQAVR